MQQPPIVFVHGAWHGGWCWDRVRQRLDAAGLVSHAVELPFTGLDEDAAAVSALLRTLDSEVVLCAHSYGALPASRAACDTGAARHLVYIAGPMVSAAQVSWYHEGRGHNMPPPFKALTPDRLKQRFYTDTSDAEFQWALARIRDMAVVPPDELGLEARPWEDATSTYVVCAHDQTAMAPAMQREMARNATYAVELETDHSPFLSSPDELTEILASIMRDGHPGRSTEHAPAAE